MVYLLPGLQYPPDDLDWYNKGYAIGLALTAYICSFMFMALLICALYNTWKYLIKQGKWRVFSLSMFYLLTIVCLSERIVMSILSI